MAIENKTEAVNGLFRAAEKMIVDGLRTISECGNDAEKVLLLTTCSRNMQLFVCALVLHIAQLNDLLLGGNRKLDAEDVELFLRSLVDLCDVCPASIRSDVLVEGAPLLPKEIRDVYWELREKTVKTIVEETLNQMRDMGVLKEQTG